MDQALEETSAIHTYRLVTDKLYIAQERQPGCLWVHGEEHCTLKATQCAAGKGRWVRWVKMKDLIEQ